MMFRYRLLLPAIMLAFSSIAAIAQGTLTGVISDLDTGESLPGANVVIDNNQGFNRGATTTLDGSFTFTNIPAGTFSVSITFVGYQDQRFTGIEITDGQTTTLNAELGAGVSLNPVVISASKFQEKVNEAPASIEVIDKMEVELINTASLTDLIKSAKSVDIFQSGAASQTVTTRGFNNIFSGSLLILQDNRIGRVPSLRVNLTHFLQFSNDDIEQIELVLGPGSALYGPNVNSGVLHFITKSPLNYQGTDISVFGGERNYFKVQGRTAFKITDKIGFKLSGQYFSVDDFELEEGNWTDASLRADFQDNQRLDDLEGNTNRFRLPELEQRAALLISNPNDPRLKNIGIRDYNAEKVAFDARLDIAPIDDFRMVFSGGLSSSSGVDLTGLGSGVTDNWKLWYSQARFTYKNIFAQAYINGSDAGDTWLVDSGNLIVDTSTFFVSQLQHQYEIGKLKLIYGADLLLTTPQSKGTINGRFEGDDKITEVGGYIQGKYALNDKLDLVASFRVDNHSELDDPVFSPRAGIVYKPIANHTFRLTYNRSFGTPTVNNFSLDLRAGSAPIIPGVLSYDVRAQGVPNSGLTFTGEQWFSAPFTNPANGQTLIPALNFNSFDPSDANFWTYLQSVIPVITQGAADISSIPAPSAGTIGSNLGLLDLIEGQFRPFTGGFSDIQSLDPTIWDTFEFGYKGIFENKLLVSFDLFYQTAEDFIGPLLNETPNLFVNGGEFSAYVTPFFQAGAQIQAAQGLSAAGQGLGIPAFDPATQSASDYIQFLGTIPGFLNAVVSNPNSPFFGLPADPNIIIGAVNQQAADGATALGSALGQLPLGVVSPDGIFDRNAIVVTYRNFGDIDLFGADVSFEYLATREWRIFGNYSWISESDWRNLDGNPNLNIFLNAPQNKGSLGVGYNGIGSGISGLLRGRFVEGFAVDGVFSTFNSQTGDFDKIDDYYVVDLTLGYKIPQVPGLRASLQVSNIFDNQKPQFAGTPDIGRLSILGLKYSF